MPVLYALRDDLGLHGPRFRLWLSTMWCMHNTPQEKLHPLQEAFIAEQAAQCGYCINGMIMQAASLLNKTPHPSVSQIKAALAGNLCRCGTHLRIVRAIQRAAAQTGGSKA